MNKAKKVFLGVLILVGGAYLVSSGLNAYNDYRMQKIYNTLPHEDWQKTQSGRYAHSLKYEDKLPSPVPFNIFKPNFFTFNSTLEKRSEEYFEHLCKTEAGNYVWKTAEKPTDSVALLRTFELPTYTRMGEYNGHEILDSVSVEEYLRTKDGLESPVNFNHFAAGKSSYIDNKKFDISQYENNDFIGIVGSSYDNYQIVFNNENIVSYIRSKNKNNGLIPDRQVDIVKSLTVNYGITWRGFNRPLDREYGIAGGDIIVVDLKTNEIMAVQRNFAKARKTDGKINWYFPLGCFELYKNSKFIKILKFNTNDSFDYKIKAIGERDIDFYVVFPFILNVLPPFMPNNLKDQEIYRQQNIINDILIKNKK